MPRRHLFIDLDGVIRQWTETNRLALPISISEIQPVAFEESLLTQVITGRLTDEEWRDEISARLAERFPPGSCKVAVTAWSESPGRIDPAVIQVLAESPFADRITLITNATSRLNRDLETLNLLGLFRHVVNSSEVGFAKPDERIFHHALNLNDCEADEVLFVDDTPRNVTAAEKLGMSGHVYLNPERLRDFLRGKTLDKWRAN